MVIVFLSREPMPSLSFGKSTMVLRCQLDGKLKKHSTLHHQYKCKASTSVRSTRHVDRGNGSATRCEGCEGKIKKLDVSISISPCLPKSILQMYCYIKSETVENPFRVSHVSHKLPDYASRERESPSRFAKQKSSHRKRDWGEMVPPIQVGASVQLYKAAAGIPNKCAATSRPLLGSPLRIQVTSFPIQISAPFALSRTWESHFRWTRASLSSPR